MKEEMVLAVDFCTYHEIEYTFISSLEDSGLVQLVEIDEQKYIPHTQLQEVEKLSRLHHELDINMAGIEAITNMLRQMEQLQREIQQLRNRLHLYE